eukprot:7051947-Alexandrium_andersonii.AAC.1
MPGGTNARDKGRRKLIETEKFRHAVTADRVVAVAAKDGVGEGLGDCRPARACLLYTSDAADDM